jgi:ubiquinone/menaquinone biosynthesis C-methylase UbiE
VILAMLLACGGTPPAPPTAPAPDLEPAAAHGDHAHHGHAQHPHPHHQHHEGAHRFDDAERWAKMFDDPERDAWQRPERVIEALALTPGMTVADVGAGTGYFAARLSPAVGERGKVLAVDIEPDMVRYLGERAARDGTPNVEARLGAADDPALPAAAVDRILIVNTWHHVADRAAYAAKLTSALRRGGFVLIVDFTHDSERGPPRGHRVSPETVVAELERGGLRAQKVDVELPDQFVIKGVRPASP